MKSLLKEKDSLHRGVIAELDFLRRELKAKSVEIDRLERELSEAKAVFEDSVMGQLQQVDDAMVKKDRENAVLRKRCEELRQTLREIKDSSVGSLEESAVFREQQDLIGQLRLQIEQILTESFIRDSQLQLDEGRLSQREQYIQLLKQEAACSRGIVHDLVKLLKFKEFQAGRLQQIYEAKVDSSRAAELNAIFDKLKPQEEPLRNRYFMLIKNVRKYEEAAGAAGPERGDGGTHGQSEGRLCIDRRVPSAVFSQMLK